MPGTGIALIMQEAGISQGSRNISYSDVSHVLLRLSFLGEILSNFDEPQFHSLLDQSKTLLSLSASFCNLISMSSCLQCSSDSVFIDMVLLSLEDIK